MPQPALNLFMNASIPPSSSHSGRKSPYLRRIAATLATSVALITAVTLAAIVLAAFKRVSADFSGLALLANTAFGLIQIPTFICLGLVTALCVFFRWFRQTPD
jgi:ABC-type Co2+ transport system permease subunit